MQAFGPFGSGVMTYFSVGFGARPLTAGSRCLQYIYYGSQNKVPLRKGSR